MTRRPRPLRSHEAHVEAPPPFLLRRAEHSSAFSTARHSTSPQHFPESLNRAGARHVAYVIIVRLTACVLVPCSHDIVYAPAAAGARARRDRDPGARETRA
jgi:hypothetical protein